MLVSTTIVAHPFSLMEPMANIALRAARLAGRHLVRGFDRPDLLKVSGQGETLVTNIQMEAGQIVVDALRSTYPDHRFTGQESGSAAADAEYEWIIDPVDGSMNFARQIPHFCISIGCLRKGRLMHGVILDPVRDEEFVASRGTGARLNGRRIRASGAERLDGTTIACGGPGRRLHLDGEIGIIREIGGRAFIRQPGCAALELAYVAAGRLDAIWMHGLSVRDITAGALLVIEAGGLIGDFQGGAGYMKSGNLVAGSPRCFKQLTAIVRKYLG